MTRELWLERVEENVSTEGNAHTLGASYSAHTESETSRVLGLLGGFDGPFDRLDDGARGAAGHLQADGGGDLKVVRELGV